MTAAPPSHRTPLERDRQAAPQIADILRRRILTLELKPSSVLSRVALQDEFGVSQTPVRDALQQLEREGLVEIYPQSSTLVSRIDVAAARQAHFLRRSIEIEAARVVASQPNEAIIRQLEAAIEEQRWHRDPEDYPHFIQADRMFHRIFYEAAGVASLWDLVRRESGHIDRLRLLNLPIGGKIDAIFNDHESLVAAVGRGDPEGAAAVVRRHLSGTLSIIDEIATAHPDYLKGVVET
jgi:DNA-binding GntR family transcriptional regulator